MSPSRWIVAAMKLRSLAEDVLGARCAAGGGAGEADPAGPSHLADPVRTDELLERVELLRLADDLEQDRVRPDVGDARAEGVGKREQLGAALRRRAHRDQRELALDRVARLELADAQHVDELVHLLLDLLERVLRAVDAERDPRDVVALG